MNWGAATDLCLIAWAWLLATRLNKLERECRGSRRAP